MERLLRIREILKNNKKSILITLVWTIAITGVIFYSWVIFYSAPKFQNLGWLHSPGEAPAIQGSDLLLLLIISVVFGFLLSGICTMVCGYLVSQILSFILGVLSAFSYNWFIRGACESWYASIPYGWEYVLFLSVIDVFRMMFPLGVIYCFVGAIIGNLLKTCLLNLR